MDCAFGEVGVGGVLLMLGASGDDDSRFALAESPFCDVGKVTDVSATVPLSDTVSSPSMGWPGTIT